MLNHRVTFGLIGGVGVGLAVGGPVLSSTGTVRGDGVGVGET